MLSSTPEMFLLVPIWIPLSSWWSLACCWNKKNFENLDDHVKSTSKGLISMRGFLQRHPRGNGYFVPQVLFLHGYPWRNSLSLNGRCQITTSKGSSAIAEEVSANRSCSSTRKSILLSEAERLPGDLPRRRLKTLLNLRLSCLEIELWGLLDSTKVETAYTKHRKSCLVLKLVVPHGWPENRRKSSE